MIWKLFVISTAIIAMYMAIMDNKAPETTIAWLLIFVIYPPVGVILYLFLGINWKRKTLNSGNTKEIKELINSYIAASENKEYKNLVELLAANSDSPIFVNNEVEIFGNGEEKFRALKRELEKAKHHIHLEYYIVNDDDIGKEIKDILIRKSNEGVKVRFIIDKMGSIRLSRSYIRELRANGVIVEIYSYFLAPLFRCINTQINYRNHRKIVVIDGKVAFTGGMNIGDEYLGKGKLGYWRDTHIMIKGDGVLGLQGIFLEDFLTIEKASNSYSFFGEDFVKYFPATIGNDGNKVMQLVKSGPESQFPSIMQGIIKMIFMAKESISIVSPYFVPTESVMEAIKIAALGGVKVKIVFPKKWDHAVVYFASKTYLQELIECGVEVYSYRDNAFIHSKIITIDSKICSVGTANMDRRSYELNYEVNCVFYDEEITRKLEDIINEDISVSKLITYEDCKEEPFYIKVCGKVCRIVSSLL